MDNKTHNEKQDVFSDKIKQKLENYELPVDDRVWKGIKSKLHGKQSFFTSPWTIMSIVAIVGVCIAFLYNSFEEETVFYTDSSSDDKKVEEIIVAEQVKNTTKESVNYNENIKDEVFEGKNLHSDKNMSQSNAIVNEHNEEKTITTKEENSFTENTEKNHIEQVVENQNTINQTTESENSIVGEVENNSTTQLDKTINLNETTSNQSNSDASPLENPGAASLNSNNNEMIVEQAAGLNYYEEDDIYSGLYSQRDNLSIVSEECHVAPSLFFTPNGDGLNDEWVIDNLECLKGGYTIGIYDRRGLLLVQHTNNYTPWNGRYLGKLMPQTDYWYIIKLANGKAKIGHFTLIR
jgi:gliding motility-associated-like protein